MNKRQAKKKQQNEERLFLFGFNYNTARKWKRRCHEMMVEGDRFKRAILSEREKIWKID